MKKVIIIFVLNSILFISCGSTYDRSYYEKITGIIIPKSSDIIETFDNGEFYTITSFRLNIVDIKKFLLTDNFKNVGPTWQPAIFGVSNLDEEKPKDRLVDCVYVAGNKGKNDWLYVVDTVRRILWAEVRYPDWG
jgi:hypothetical protein